MMGSLVRPAGLLLIFALLAVAESYRPVIIMHGILDSPKDMQSLKEFVTKAHPGTDVYVVDAYNDLDSLVEMWEQVGKVYKLVEPIFANATDDGVDMICFSQGGLICRAILELHSVNVHSFISLSSPQAGQYGDSVYLKYLFPNFSKDHIYLLFYTKDGQKISIANYWNDPHHQDRYKQYCNFLPFLNNGSDPSYKKNFLNVQQLVLIGGPDDGVITPWQSSHFSFFDENEFVIPMELQDFYVKDLFGLKTLNDSKRLSIYSVPGVEHVHWHSNQTVFDCCIEPWLR